MSKMQPHIQTQHAADAESCIGLGRCCKAMFEHFQEVAGDDEGSVYRKISGAFNKMAGHYGDAAQRHIEAVKNFDEKAMDDADLNKLMPDFVTSVIPSDAPLQKVRPVPRYGAPEINIEGIPSDFKHLLAVDDGLD